MWKSDLLGGQLLRNVAGGFSYEQTDVALPATKKITALLFSALWCPPCEQFLKDLIVFYDKMALTHSDFEIILVSSDKDKRQFSKYFSKMSWLAVPHEAEDVKCRLTKKYCVDSVPTLVILGPDGSIITKKGREKLYGDPNGLLFPWCRRSISDELGHQFYKSATNISSDEKCTSSKTITTVNIKNVFTNNRHVALYFTAKWCSPCKPFTGIFMKYCDSLKERYGAACDLQVIICSMDQEEIEFQDLFLKTCPDWLAIPHYEKRRVEALSERFNVENIPHVVLIAPDTSIVNFSARRKIEMNPSAIGFPECLYSPLIENLGTTTKSFGYDLNQKPALVLFMENATPEQQMAVIKKVEPFAITLARNKSSIADGPDMLFFINTTASSVGEKLRALVGLPSASRLNKPIPGHRPVDHTHHTNGISYDGIAGMVRGSHEEKKSRGFCTESACHINESTGTGKKVSSEDGTRKGSKKDVQNDMKGESKSIEKGGDGVVKCVGEHLDDASHVTLESDGDDILDMYLVILDVPDGGDFYKYPCHSANPILSHIPSFMHAVVGVDITATGSDIDDTKIAGVDAEEVVEEQKYQPPVMEGEQVAEQKESENATREGTDQHDIVSSITGADVSFGSLEVLTDNSSIAGSASTITTHETLKGKYSAEFPQITASNIDQITRRFISDYQANELRKSKLGQRE